MRLIPIAVILALASSSLAAPVIPGHAYKMVVASDGTPTAQDLGPSAEVKPSPGAPPIGQQLLDLLFSEKGLGILAVVVGAIGGLIGTNEIRRRRLALATYHAFHVVEDLSKETENTVDDKVAAGLKALDAYLLANGWRPAKPGEQEVAKLGFQSLNGASKLAEKIAVAATEASKPSPQ